jgi:signal recognition particle receptor subunit beta
MSVYKIIFTGPVGAGKTTAISSLSDIPIVTTEETVTDMTSERKPKTTVAMDYGRIQLANQTAVHLYGTPGQERFDFMWDILTEGGIGLVLLLDNCRDDPMQDLHFFVKAFWGFIDRTALVVGVTRTDLRSVPLVIDYARALVAIGLPQVPVFEVDARRKRDVSLLVEALLCTLDPTVEDE